MMVVMACSRLDPLVSGERSRRQLLQVEVLGLFDGDSNAKDLPALERIGASVFVADRVGAIETANRADHSLSRR
jgi:hypothetical protein